jgi:hypothetical protein
MNQAVEILTHWTATGHGKLTFKHIVLPWAMSPNNTQMRATARFIVPVSNQMGNKDKQGRTT